MGTHNYTIQICTIDDYPAVRQVVDQSESLDHHTNYTYWVALSLWPELFLVAKDERRVVGFTFGLRNAANPERLFLWQVGVLSSARKQGIATSLVKELYYRGAQNGAQELWTTISDEIAPSLGLFRKVAATFGSTMIERGSTGSLGGQLHPERIYSITLPRLAL